MERDHIATLISINHNQDAIGQMIPVDQKREVFCRLNSISQSEWFKAGQAGLRPQYKLTLFEADYQGEQIVELDGVRYSVYRTYLAKSDRMELYLERKAGT